MHSLKIIYRGRRYHHTPILSQALNRIINHFGGRGNIPEDLIVEFIHGLQDHGFPDGDSWKTFYERLHLNIGLADENKSFWFEAYTELTV